MLAAVLLLLAHHCWRPPALPAAGTFGSAHLGNTNLPLASTQAGAETFVSGHLEKEHQLCPGINPSLDPAGYTNNCRRRCQCSLPPLHWADAPCVLGLTAWTFDLFDQASDRT
jgi:hypothetical protein